MTGKIISSDSLKGILSNIQLNGFLSITLLLIIMFAYTFEFFSDGKRRADLPTFYYAGKIFLTGSDLYNYDEYRSVSNYDPELRPYLYSPLPAMFFSAGSMLSLNTFKYLVLFLDLFALVLTLRMAILMVRTDIVDNYSNRRGLSPDLKAHIIVLISAFVFSIRNIFNLGNIDIMMCLLITSTLFLTLRKKDVTAGAILSMAFLIKLLPLFLLAYFFLTKKYRVIYGFIIGLAACVIVSSLLGGVHHWFDYINTLSSKASNFKFSNWDSDIAVFYNFSIFAFFKRLVMENVKLAYLLTYITFGAIFIVSWFMLKDKLKTSNTHRYILPFLILMILSTPLTWGTYFVYFFAGFCYFINMLWHESKPGKRIIYTGLAFLLLAVYRTNYPAHFVRIFGSFYQYPLITSIGLYSVLILLFYFLLFNKRSSLNFSESRAQV